MMVAYPEDLDVPHATFTAPDLTTYSAVSTRSAWRPSGNIPSRDRAVWEFRVVAPDDWCRRCEVRSLPGTPQLHPQMR